MCPRVPWYKRAMAGALVGDAAGAVLEFHREPITAEKAEAAMRMPGGGTWNVGPGQITDDGELTLALWNTLKRWPSLTGIPVTNMIRAYAEWLKSRPFDVGGTCGYAFAQASRVVAATPEGESLNTYAIREMYSDIDQNNMESEANGCLMRSTAIACWVALGQDTPAIRAIHAAEVDAELSHPNVVCREVNAVYVAACTLLMRGLTPEEVLAMITEYVEKNVTSPSVKKWFLEDSLADPGDMDCKVNAGHVRWAFTLAMHFLRRPEVSYEEAIRVTLMKGGDTDTNACIVGGLVACYQPIPSYMLDPVLAFDCTSGKGRKRPAAYSAGAYFPAPEQC
jgi:ADP-ribosyl-[dinitrogen reductase] hydrolase